MVFKRDSLMMMVLRASKLSIGTSKKKVFEKILNMEKKLPFLSMMFLPVNSTFPFILKVY